jgi:hypothetical protein
LSEEPAAAPAPFLKRLGINHDTLDAGPPMLVRVALANKMARMVWALLANGGTYRAPVAAA